MKIEEIIEKYREDFDKFAALHTALEDNDREYWENGAQGGEEECVRLQDKMLESWEALGVNIVLDTIGTKQENL